MWKVGGDEADDPLGWSPWTYPGLDANRTAILNDSRGNYSDGVMCATGQPALNADEAKVQRQKLEEAFTNSSSSIARIYLAGNLEKFISINVWNISANCKAKNCSFNFPLMSFVCGDVAPPNPKYANHKSCLDGSEVQSEKQVKKLIQKEFGIDSDKGAGPGNSAIKMDNEEAQALYGKNCQSGKCYYHSLRGNYICRSSSIKPFTLLLVLLTTVGILPLYFR